MKIPAFKEWDSVVRALGSGEQSVILRKGGIHEQNRLFQIRHTGFLLFPTREHQSAEDLNEAGKKHLEASRLQMPDAGKIRLEYEAVLEKAWWVPDLKFLPGLSPFHTASQAGVEKKFSWGERPGLHVLLVRVFCLGSVLEIPDLSAYGGCRSWVELDLEENALARSKSVPVLTEPAFSETARKISAVLAGCEEITLQGQS